MSEKEEHAGTKNLIPFSERTKEEQKRITRMGGIASGEARRRKKAARQEMLDLLETPIELSPEFQKALEESGLGFLLKEKNATMQTALIASIFRGASIDGNPKLAELALALIGEKPADAVNVNANVEANAKVVTAADVAKEILGKK